MRKTINHIFMLVLCIGICISSVSAQTHFVIQLDEAGTATFSGNGTDLTEELPPGVSFSNGTIRGSSTALTKKTADVWSFAFSFQDSVIEVYLSELAVVKDLKGQLSVNDQQQIRIIANDSVQVSYTISAQELSAREAIKEKNNLLLIIIVFLVIIATVIIFAKNYLNKVLQKFSRKKSKKNDANRQFILITQLLNNKENAILTILRERGPMKSSYLQRLSGIPKSSFFRNLQGLEKKKLVKRMGLGRNKIIELLVR